MKSINLSPPVVQHPLWTLGWTDSVFSLGYVYSAGSNNSTNSTKPTKPIKQLEHFEQSERLEQALLFAPFNWGALIHALRSLPFRFELSAISYPRL